MEPYNRHCYMVTDFNYNLEKVEKYLLEKEKCGEVVIRKSICNEKGKEKTVIINEIPYYNRNEESGNNFIDFYCLVKDKNELQKEFFGNNPIFYKELEQFKKF